MEQVVDLAHWDRTEHFRFFQNVAYPIYNICFDLDVTPLKAYAKAHAISFNYALVHLVTATANAIDNFKYRLRGDQVILHDQLTPSCTDLSPGATLFKMVTIGMEESLDAFARKAKAQASEQACYFKIEDFVGKDDLLFISMLPWIRFTSIDHTMSLKQGDAMPRITWGRYEEQHGRWTLPFNIQVNHLFVDGIHLGQFQEQLLARIASLQG